MASISCSPSRAPAPFTPFAPAVPSAAATSTLTRSSRGSARRRVAKSEKYSTSSAAAPSAARITSGVGAISNVSVRAAAGARNQSRSPSGTPITSQITLIGSREAKTSMKSTTPDASARPAISSSRSSTAAAIRGASAGILRAAKNDETRALSRVWPGGLVSRSEELMIRCERCSPNPGSIIPRVSALSTPKARSRVSRSASS
ncbi:hypothetical protein [Streptomyces sp. NPDC088196]|uniref:hypothetical protein n=1 Tax=Streptomyces sp. NPDC088196 TaxID=3154868 RepID=UPI00344E5933